MLKNPYFLKIKNCDDRWECQRSQIISTCHTNDASNYEVAVVILLFCIAPVVHEIWAFYFQNLISQVVGQLHVMRWLSVLLLVCVYQCWVLDYMRIEVLLVILWRKVGSKWGWKEEIIALVTDMLTVIFRKFLRTRPVARYQEALARKKFWWNRAVGAIEFFWWFGLKWPSFGGSNLHLWCIFDNENGRKLFVW